MEIHADDHPDHLAADLHELLAEEAGELGVRVECDGDTIVLTGSVHTVERSREVVELVRARVPGRRVENRLEILEQRLEPPRAEEQL